MITTYKNLKQEVNEVVLDPEVKIFNSTLDEYIITNKSIEGYVLKETYSLKAAENGSKFKYDHELKEGESLEEIRKYALIQLQAWQESRKEQV